MKSRSTQREQQCWSLCSEQSVCRVKKPPFSELRSWTSWSWLRRSVSSWRTTEARLSSKARSLWQVASLLNFPLPGFRGRIVSLTESNHWKALTLHCQKGGPLVGAHCDRRDLPHSAYTPASLSSNETDDPRSNLKSTSTPVQHLIPHSLSGKVLFLKEDWQKTHSAVESLGVSQLPYVVFYIGHMSWFGRNTSPTYVLTDVRSLFWSHLTLDLTLGIASYKSFILLFLLFLFPPPPLLAPSPPHPIPTF